MPRPQGELPATISYSDGDARRYFTDPLFHAQVYAVMLLAQHVYGVEKDEGIAFGINVVNAIENVGRNGQSAPLDGS